MKHKKLKRIATEKQIEQIDFIKESCGVKFAGETAKDVRKFIKEWMPRANRTSVMEDNIISLIEADFQQSVGVKVPVYHVKYDNRAKEFSEEMDLRDTIAHEQLKGDLLRGRDPRMALLAFQRRTLLEKMMLDDDYEY